MAKEASSCKSSGPLNAGSRPVEYGSAGPRTVYVLPTTGGQIEIQLPSDSSVTNLRRVVANRLRVPKDRIVLLYKTRQLTEGNLEDYQISEGASLTLLPNVETGLLAQRPEQSVLQALESLSDNQVDNFLTGRAPLNLTMRLGDHMMFIQLQLSTMTPSSSSSSSSSSGNGGEIKTCSAGQSQSAQTLPTPPTTPTSPSLPSSPLQFPVTSSSVASSVPPSPPPSPKVLVPPILDCHGQSSTVDDIRSALNTRALAEASRNLTQTLRQLSSAALGKKGSHCCNSHKQGGAVIETMYHHGRGVYSGTFSGTLSPALQDCDGRPRRDISTIIHILNDLLGASSQCRPSSSCQCSVSPTSHIANSQGTLSTQQHKVSGHVDRQDENKALREKVVQLQSMLEERRQRRRARREERTSPYSTVNRICMKQKNSYTNDIMECDPSVQSATLASATVSTNDTSEQITDFNSEAAVA